MTNPAESTDDLSVDDLFELLGSETRMDIMQVLWDETSFPDYVTDSLSPVPFSTLRTRAGAGDSGNFNYHLQLLLGVTIDRSDEGYQLTPRGYHLMRMIERYASFEYQQVPPTTLEEPCPFCDGELIGRYQRELVHVRCEDCWGLGDDGTINYVQIPSPGREDVTFDWLLDAATMEMEARIRHTAIGVCPDCRSDLEREIEPCPSHSPNEDGRCEACESRFSRTIHTSCPACGWGGSGPVLEVALLDPSVRAAFEAVDRGPRSAGPWTYRLNALRAVEETDTTRDHARFALAIDERTIEVAIDPQVLTG